MERAVWLTEGQWEKVVAAIAACTRSGGGSAMYTLACNVADQAKVGIHAELVVPLQKVAAEEWNEEVMGGN